ncbi:MAG: methyl-accepting chemotaxis protein [Kangiellaceae bacterium]|jgi:methyl-accepting chemotaxis protein
MWLNAISIKLRLYLLAVVPIIIALFAVSLIIFQINSKLAVSESQSAYQLLHDAEKSKLKSIMNIAYNAVKPLYNSGATKQEAIEILKRFKYGDDSYIFGYSGKSTQLFLGDVNASTVGNDYTNFKDVNGVYFINDMVTGGKKNNFGKGDNFVLHHSTRFGGQTPYPKLSYSIFFDRWDLMIGTGVYIDHIDESIAQFKHDIVETQNETYASLAIVGVIYVIVVLLIGALVIGSILKPLNVVSSSIEMLSKGDGDLTQRIPIQDNFETGLIAKHLNNLLVSLQKNMTSVFSIASEIKTETNMLVEQANKINDVSTLQSSTIKVVSHASGGLIQMSTEVAQHTTSASEATKSVNASGKCALQKVESSMSEMTELNLEMANASNVVLNVGTDVENISAILQVIESIAEQTNLLALNAAIEAARAGEQGRGFAVVADEVRNLASKTQGSTEEIKNMINKLQNGSKSAVEAMQRSMKRSSAAEKSVNETAASLKEIANSVDVIHNMNEQIVTASNNQNTAGREIDLKVDEISKLISQLNAIACDNNNTSAKLLTKAGVLDDIVAQFKL